MPEQLVAAEHARAAVAYDEAGIAGPNNTTRSKQVLLTHHVQYKSLPLNAPRFKSEEQRLPWTLAEDKVVIRSAIEFGHQWNLIAQLLPGRSEHAIRNRYSRLQSLHKNSEVADAVLQPLDQLETQLNHTVKPFGKSFDSKGHLRSQKPMAIALKTIQAEVSCPCFQVDEKAICPNIELGNMLQDYPFDTMHCKLSKPGPNREQGSMVDSSDPRLPRTGASSTFPCDVCDEPSEMIVPGVQWSGGILIQTQGDRLCTACYKLLRKELQEYIPHPGTTRPAGQLLAYACNKVDINIDLSITLACCGGNLHHAMELKYCGME
eukprot:CAMPEP_0119329482 /NCGR_PEP_ID=MMETSP1333-20130426/75958_1 /TAXON_ID=418940 /ORGANISM="Scyphosphaera apsteinii, Strain RCC1455" /LENGTH=319 /DNA_ID=CAMNT_0007338611 /DNA_START=107 /DNA_END=1066 /DNA_ORIENTATION=-